jgi:hypothetical protein
VPGNLRGQAQPVAVYVDPALGADGRTDADGVLAKCEADYARVSRYFAGPSAGRFSVILFSNPNGIFHMTCAATDLFSGAKSGAADGNYSEFLNIAGLLEVVEAVQKKGWNCGKSAAEGLSRLVANEPYPAQLDGFATAQTWLDSRRPNYFQLSYSWAQIVGAGAPTLGKAYTKPTGKADGFKQFKALPNAHFPIGRPSWLMTDNPFPDDVKAVCEISSPRSQSTFAIALTSFPTFEIAGAA